MSDSTTKHQFPFYDNPRISTDESLIEILQRRGKDAHARLRRDFDRRLKYGHSMAHQWYGHRGFVYVVYFGFQNIYKIGVAKDVPGRMNSMGAVEAPFTMNVEHTIATDDMFVVESSLHQYFNDDRMGGEWFRLSLNQLALVKSIQEIFIHDKEANGDPYTLMEDKKPEIKNPFRRIA